jgi:hypothetical protein
MTDVTRTDKRGSGSEEQMPGLDGWWRLPTIMVRYLFLPKAIVVAISAHCINFTMSINGGVLG